MLAPATQVNELNTLVGLFFSETSHLGTFTGANAAALPDPARHLLARNHHMTAALEDYEGEKLAVEVLQWASDGNRYWREILLRRPSDGRTVQFAIVRLDFSCFDAEVKRKVEVRQAPLGRILMESGIALEIEVRALWRVIPSRELCRIFEVSAPTTVHGRTAIIHCNGKPAIELLEILAPRETA